MFKKKRIQLAHYLSTQINSQHRKYAIHQSHKQLGLMSNHAMRLDTTPACKRYHSPTRTSPHDATKTS
jgi:hypothetical protein